MPDHRPGGAGSAGDPLHFERRADTYADARPDYPAALYRHLRARGVTGPGREVLEVGAGSGQATRGLVADGCRVTAVEPGAELGRRLRESLPGVIVLGRRLEDAALPAAAFDAAVAATSLHWVDLDVALPLLHRVLRPDGRLAVWRTTYGDPRHQTPFRRDVERIVARRGTPPGPRTPEPRPTVAELERGGRFHAQETWEHAWSLELAPVQLRRLFATFSDWSDSEVDEVEQAAAAQGPLVREHYVTRLVLLRRV